MKSWLETIGIAAAVALVASVAMVKAAQTNYFGTMFVADFSTPSHQLKVNSDGSINIDSE